MGLMCRLFGCVYPRWDRVMFCERCGKMAERPNIPLPPKRINNKLNFMEAKFKKGEKAVINNHPNSELIGKTVMIEIVGHAKFRENVGYVDQAIYQVSLDGKSLGWAPEEDLSSVYQFKETPFKDSNELIDKFVKENNFDPMHLQMYLDEKYGVTFGDDFNPSFGNYKID